LHYAKNAVYGGSWSLVKELKDTYTYPNHGWRWADSKKEAKQLFNLRKVKLEGKETDDDDTINE
jgi:hypothetical protein